MTFSFFLKAYLRKLRFEMKKKFNRKVSTGDLLTNRWENANFLGFGEGTSLYDNVLVIGNVKVGKDTWIGPNVVLDGSGKLSIGNNCSISAGVQIYSHDSVDWAVSGGKAEYKKMETEIGNNVYIGPNAIIKAGISIGDGAKVGALSYVDKNVPKNCRAYGAPVKLLHQND